MIIDQWETGPASTIPHAVMPALIGCAVQVQHIHGMNRTMCFLCNSINNKLSNDGDIDSMGSNELATKWKTSQVQVVYHIINSLMLM